MLPDNSADNNSTRSYWYPLNQPAFYNKNAVPNNAPVTPSQVNDMLSTFPDVLKIPNYAAQHKHDIVCN